MKLLKDRINTCYYCMAINSGKWIHAIMVPNGCLKGRLPTLA
jgi:hypothetical protein